MVHEWALAEAIVRYIEELSKGKGRSTVKKLVIKLGVLQSIDREVLEFSLKELLKLRGIKVKELLFEDEEVVLRCRVCGYEWRLDMSELDNDVREAIHFVPEVVHAYIKCPRCGSRDFDIVKGRGVEVKEVIFDDA